MREVTVSVLQDELKAIEKLCSILNITGKSHGLFELSKVSSIMSQWQDLPPSEIAEQLEGVKEELKNGS